MRIDVAEQVRRRGWQQPRRRPVAQIIGIEQDQVPRVRGVELVELEAAVEGRQIPLQLVDEDLLAGGEHGAKRRIPGRILRPRGLSDHDGSLACRCQDQTIIPTARLCPEMGNPGTIYVRASERAPRSEEHTSELQSLMRISYAVFCLKKQIKTENQDTRTIPTT